MHMQQSVLPDPLLLENLHHGLSTYVKTPESSCVMDAGGQEMIKRDWPWLIRMRLESMSLDAASEGYTYDRSIQIAEFVNNTQKAAIRNEIRRSTLTWRNSSRQYNRTWDCAGSPARFRDLLRVDGVYRENLEHPGESGYSIRCEEAC